MTHMTHFPYKRPTRPVRFQVLTSDVSRPSYSECVMCVMRHGQAIAELWSFTHVARHQEPPAVRRNRRRQHGCHRPRQAGAGTSDDDDDDQSRSGDCYAACQDCGRRSRRRRVDSGAEGSGRLPGSRSLACPPGWRQRMRRFASEAPSKEDPGPPEPPAASITRIRAKAPLLLALATEPIRQAGTAARAEQLARARRVGRDLGVVNRSDYGPGIRLEAICAHDRALLREADVTVADAPDPDVPKVTLRRARRTDPLEVLKRVGTINAREREAGERLRDAIEREQRSLPSVSRSEVHVAPWDRPTISERQLRACQDVRACYCRARQRVGAGSDVDCARPRDDPELRGLRACRPYDSGEPASPRSLRAGRTLQAREAKGRVGNNTSGFDPQPPIVLGDPEAGFLGLRPIGGPPSVDFVVRDPSSDRAVAPARRD